MRIEGFTEGTALDLRGRSRHGAPDRKIVGGPHFASAPQKDRDAVCAPQAHSQARPFTVTRPKWRARRVHSRSHGPEPSQDGQADPDAHVKADIENPEALGRFAACAVTMNYCRSFLTESAPSGG